jgi:hypothetical protein
MAESRMAESRMAKPRVAQQRMAKRRVQRPEVRGVLPPEVRQGVPAALQRVVEPEPRLAPGPHRWAGRAAVVSPVWSG